MSDHNQKSTRSFIDELEETVIAVLLAAMVIITFINVVLRYGFNTGLIWGLELVSFLFAWLVLFGISYTVKVSAHLGIDALLNITSGQFRKFLLTTSVILCIIYAALLFKGAWDYWANFANLPQTTGRWFPLGFEEMRSTSYRAWYEVIDIPFPNFLRWIEPLMNEGQAYEKLPRFIPYAILPIGAALLLFRFGEVAFALYRGRARGLIASHEAEQAVEELNASQRKD